MGLMRGFRKLLVTGFVWLTACATLAAALPHWQCCCTHRSQVEVSGAASCHCCGQTASKGPLKNCCQAKETRKVSTHRWQSPVEAKSCARTFAVQATYAVDRFERQELKAPAQFLEASFATLPPVSAGWIVASARCAKAHAPPADRVLLFEHFII